MFKAGMFKQQKAFWSFAVLFFFLIFTDQFVKFKAQDIFRNDKFAFSLPLPIGLIYFIYFLVLSLMVVYVRKKYSKFSPLVSAAWVLIFAGALSNIGERIIFGYVRDFIYVSLYQWTGIYNLADGYIILGIIILFFQSSRSSRA